MAPRFKCASLLLGAQRECALLAKVHLRERSLARRVLGSCPWNEHQIAAVMPSVKLP
jgi:hypothetical protein